MKNDNLIVKKNENKKSGMSNKKKMAVSTRFELAIFCVTGRRDNHYTTRPKMVAGDGFEPSTFGL